MASGCLLHLAELHRAGAAAGRQQLQPAASLGQREVGAADRRERLCGVARQRLNAVAQQPHQGWQRPCIDCGVRSLRAKPVAEVGEGLASLLRAAAAGEGLHQGLRCTCGSGCQLLIQLALQGYEWWKGGRRALASTRANDHAPCTVHHAPPERSSCWQRSPSSSAIRSRRAAAAALCVAGKGQVKAGRPAGRQGCQADTTAWSRQPGSLAAWQPGPPTCSPRCQQTPASPAVQGARLPQTPHCARWCTRWRGQRPLPPLTLWTARTRPTSAAMGTRRHAEPLRGQHKPGCSAACRGSAPAVLRLPRSALPRRPAAPGPPPGWPSPRAAWPRASAPACR